MSEILVHINEVSKVFAKPETRALDRINAVIPKGEIVGLVGPDGAGKTTLIRLIAGLLLPSSGSIDVGGYSTVSHANDIHEILGYMPQKFGLYEDLTVMQNLNLYADLKGLIGKKDRQEVFQNLLAFTNLAPFTDRLAGDLSGGMKQKLGLACTLIQKPTLLLLDEPSVGVDPLSRRELWKMVQGLLGEGISVVWSTAYLDEAERCDTVLLLNEGKLLFHGSPKDLTKRVDGRVFKISNIQGSRRPILENALYQEGVIDGVIQGSDVRIVVREKLFDMKPFEGEPAIRVSPAASRFEDAFVDILGGGPGGGSVLAEKTPKVPQQKETLIEKRGI